MDKVTLYTNPEADILKEEIKSLEIQVGFLNDEITEAEKLIHDFAIRQTNELGDLLRELLRIKKDKLEREQNGTEARKREFEQAKQEYEEYSKQYEEDISEKHYELTDDEKKELKTKYRKATKLCHPDLVTDELKEQAEAVFKELQKAYEQNDLKKVSEILEMLERGDMFIHKSEGITEVKKLAVIATSLRSKIQTLKEQLAEIKNSESYQTIVQIEDWDDYFRVAKSKLIYELETLKNI
jgi:hypothetical protein